MCIRDSLYIVSFFADFVKICDEMGYFKFGVDRGVKRISHVFFAACQADLIEEVNNTEHLLRIIRYKLIQRAIVRERIVIRRFRPTPLLD